MYIADSPLQENYRRLLRSSALAAFCVHLSFIVVFAHYGVLWLALFNIGSIAAHAYAFTLTRPGGNLLRCAKVMEVEVVLHAALATFFIGWDSGFHYLMIPLVPMAMLSTHRTLRARVTIALVASAFYIALKLWSHTHPPLYTLPRGLVLAFDYGCLLTLFGFFISIAARYRSLLAQSEERLSREASTDPLTGALNRRRMGQVAAALRHSRDASALLLCDLDHFKQVNDVHGHDAGDLVLQAFFQRLQTCTRPHDYAGRWGGEEFLLLLPHTDAAQARAVAQRLLASLHATEIALPDGTTLHITATIGLTLLLPHEPLQSGVQRADAALYQGKAAGRNQVQENLPVAP